MGPVRRRIIDAGALVEAPFADGRGSALARAAITRLQRGQADRRVNVVIQEGLSSEGDPRLLAVVFDNLFGNAWKFTGRRDEARIEFGATLSGGHSVYFVRDNGAGIPTDLMPSIFDPFVTTKAYGRGLGLVSVRGLARRCDHRHREQRAEQLRQHRSTQRRA